MWVTGVQTCALPIFMIESTIHAGFPVAECKVVTFVMRVRPRFLAILCAQLWWLTVCVPCITMLLSKLFQGKKKGERKKIIMLGFPYSVSLEIVCQWFRWAANRRRKNGARRHEKFSRHLVPHILIGCCWPMLTAIVSRSASDYDKVWNFNMSCRKLFSF